MKKICKILLFFIILQYQNFGQPNQEISFAKTQTIKYAKVLSGCVLYKSQGMSDEIDDVYFVIPETYFVAILEDVNEDMYKVQYDNFIGYVKKEFVLIATFVPNVKYLTDIKCDIKQTSGTQIWSKPSASGNVLTTIPAGTLEIEYISYIFGEIPVGGESNVWYYISYTPISNSTNVYQGYVYSENVTNLTEIPVNLEENPEIQIEQEVENDNVQLSSTFKTIIIALISVPIILLISIILYKSIKIIVKNTIKRNNQNNYEQKNLRYEHDFNNENSDHSFGDGYVSLKDEIDEMRNKTFIRKSAHTHTKKKYPSFPIYDSEDDLL